MSIPSKAQKEHKLFSPIAEKIHMMLSFEPHGYISLSGVESQFAVDQVGDVFVIEEWQRGSTSVFGTFSSVEVATRQIMQIAAAEWRFYSGLGSLYPNSRTLTVPVAETADGFRLEFRGEWAEFPRGFSGGLNAKNFGVVAATALPKIWASYQHPTGKPLF